MCKKTCTGSGKDSSRFSKPYSGIVYTTKKYATRCLFYKASALAGFSSTGKCSRWIMRSCRKTCTGKGKDGRWYSKPYSRKVAVVEKTIKFPSMCAYYKSQGRPPMGRCRNSHIKRHCKLTCGGC